MKPFHNANLSIRASEGEEVETFDICRDENGEIRVYCGPVTPGERPIPISATLRWALGFVLKQLYFEE